jgi:hypothetical protein
MCVFYYCRTYYKAVAPIDRSSQSVCSQSVSEDRPEIDSFRTKNVD